MDLQSYDVTGQPSDRRLAVAVLPVALLAYAGGALSLPFLQADERMAVALLLLLPALPVGVFVVTRSILGDRLAGTIVAVACIFVSAANFRARAYDDKSIDWQVALKLIALSLLLATAAVFMAYAMKHLRLGRLFYDWLVFFLCLVGVSVYAVSPVFALICSISFVACYAYATYMTVWLSRIRAIEIMMMAALLMCVGSIVVYYALPSMGRMQAWTEGAVFGDTGRMKGLTGSANAIGIIAAFALTAAILYFREFNRFGRHVAFALVPSALACLYLSNNRGSMIAVAAALWFSYVFRGGTNFKIVLSATGAVVATALLVSFPDEIFAMLSRSGRVDEITSATGRSAIWAVVIELWAQRPILGYGYTSALLLLPSDPRLFNVAAHAHNMFLELLFAGGILLFAAFSYAAIRTFVEIYRLRAINEGALLVFFLARGLTEAGPFGGMTGYTSIAFAVTLALVISKSIEARSRTAVNARPASSRLQALRA